MNYNKALKRIEEYVKIFYVENADTRLFYHNYNHTAEVVDSALKIAGYYQLDERSRFIILAAAWFHATGYGVTKTVAPEGKSAEVAERFLKSIEVLPPDIDEVVRCIAVVEGLQKPASVAEKVVCDATMFFLQPGEFAEKSKLLKKEIEALENRKISRSEWRTEIIKRLETHQYYTEYCKSLLDIPKSEYVERIKSKQKERLEIIEANALRNSSASVPAEAEVVDNTVTPVIAKKKRAKRGIETMYRVSSGNSMRISEMADAKAHIMISVNSIIISVVLGLLLRNLDENKNLIIPTIILLAVNVTTIIYAVLATRPMVASGVFTKEQVEDRSVNLIFFGNFYKMDFEEYDYGVTEMMEDREFLYKSLRKDIFGQGKVLGRKYQLLHKSYSVFMYGILGSVVAYTVAVLIKVLM